MNRENPVRDKSKKFAVRIVNLYKYLCAEKREYVLSKQLLRSGTSIGANISEALEGQSTADFIAKMSISLKESRETEYWLELLYETEYLTEVEYSGIREEARELARILTAIIKTSKENRG